ncbi:unnamed protein product, partial [Staurois parvus]
MDTCQERGGAVRTGHTRRPDCRAGSSVHRHARSGDELRGQATPAGRTGLQSKLAGFGEGTACYEELRGQP